MLGWVTILGMERQLARGTVLENRYEIKDRIGKGGMGVVYTATHLHLKRTVAVKVLHPSEADNEGMIKRFKIEARSAANVHHPHIVEVMDYGVTPDARPFFVMEYLQGESLADKLDREKMLREWTVVEISEQILVGLSVAHKAGIVHRDMKPENVFLCPVQGKRDTVKILDFGISRMMGGTTSRPPTPLESGQQRLTGAGVVLGTPGYMAPEGLFGDTVDERADLFSVGVLMFEMITGTRPFKGEDPRQAMVATASKPVPGISYLNPNVSKAMQRLITTALAKNPDDRFQTATEFLNQLSAAAVGRVSDDARPCVTRTGIPSIVPPSAAMDAHKAPNPRDRKRNEFESIAPKARKSKNKRALVPTDDRRILRDSVYPTPPRDSKTPMRKPRNRQIRFSISPLYLLIIVGLGAAFYYFYSRDELVASDRALDPIDAQIEELGVIRSQGNVEPEVVEPTKILIRDDGVIVPASVTVWIETFQKNLKVKKDEQLLLERPLILQGDLESVELVFEAPGYQPKTYVITPDREQTLSVELKKKKNK